LSKLFAARRTQPHKISASKSLKSASQSVFGPLKSGRHLGHTCAKQIDDPLGKATLFAYDERGNLSKRADALSHVTQWIYEALDRMVQETNAINGVTSSATAPRETS
jgi:YD repeat-containing protein